MDMGRTLTFNINFRPPPPSEGPPGRLRGCQYALALASGIYPLSIYLYPTSVCYLCTAVCIQPLSRVFYLQSRTKQREWLSRVLPVVLQERHVVVQPERRHKASMKPLRVCNHAIRGLHLHEDGLDGCWHIVLPWV